MHALEKQAQTLTPSEILAARSLRLQKRNAIVRCAVLLLVFSALVAAVFSFFGISSVSGSSMEPTLHEGNILFVRKIGAEYGVGDIVVYKTASGRTNVKRIVALGGDVVELKNGQLYVNGQLAEEREIYEQTERRGDAVTYPYTVPAGEIFVLGDHRSVSVDSRQNGAVKCSDVIGIVLFSVEAAQNQE